MAWYINSDINDGYPYNTEYPEYMITDWTDNELIPLPYSAWRISPGINDNYPYIGFWLDTVPGGGDGGEVNYNHPDIGDVSNRSTPWSKYFFSSGATAYALKAQEVTSFLAEVNRMYITDADTTQMELDFKGSNPTDYIIGLYGYPFELNTGVRLPQAIKIGAVSLQTEGIIINNLSEGDRPLDLGSIDIQPYFNDFRDYAPYTTLQLYIPLCGTVSLDTALYMGHTLSVDMVYNIYTGACIARIYRDDLLDKTVNSNIATEIPISAAAMGTYQNNIKQIEQGIKQQESQILLSTFATAATTVAGAMIAPSPLTAMGAVSAAGSITQGLNKLESLNYSLDHTQPPISSTSAGDTILGMQAAVMRGLLLIKRPQALPGFNPEAYGRTVGYACCMQGKVSDFTGYTVCGSIDTTGISATVEEVSMIHTLFKSGVYL